MIRETEALGAVTYDVAIIGGGITGACLALDASARGMSVALVEKGDFGAATSSASSKVLHGGIRYLQQGRLLKLRESALERVYFQRLAPHLTRYVPFVVPAYPGLRKGRLLLSVGLAAYEALCTGQNRHVDDPAKQVPTGRLLGKDEIREMVNPSLGERMTGGVVVYESHMRDSERMTLSFVRTAAEHGAVVTNYTRAESFLQKGDRVIGIRARDLIGGSTVEIRSSAVVNAAGPWIPSTLERLGERIHRRLVTAFGRGAHIVTKPLTDGYAIALPIPEQNEALVNRGGRHVFVIPWRGHSLIGTTYGPYHGDPDDVAADESDVEELLELINAAFGERVLIRRDVVHAYAGLYPLTAEQVDPEVYQGRGDYRVVDHERTDGVKGLLSVLGAKFTTARRVAEKAVDVLARKLDGDFSSCRTRRMRLVGGEVGDLEAYREKKRRQYASVLSADAVDHLVHSYGTEMDDLVSTLQGAPQLAERLSSERGTLAVEVVHAVRSEMARRLEDVVFRRTGLGDLGHPGMPALRRCAELMGRERGWDEERIEEELRSTETGFL